MQDFELLGHFYLGKRFDPAAGQVTSDLLLYDSKDLTTHAVCVGMTGSGKSGLCISLLEEAAIDGIPAIAIDPKGDLGNLLLTFPELRPEDFKPWIDPGQATREGKTVEQVAAETASRWREGLQQWGQSPERIARFRNAADVAVYTPGSNAGRPLAVLRSLAAPSDRSDSEAFRQRIGSCVSGLLTLLGINGDPVQSREHILLSTILAENWTKGQSLKLTDLIRQVQSPPVQQIGVFDLETFFPTSERTALAMAINNLLASPTFASWLEGEPLDVHKLLYTSAGKPRLSIVSIAHLSDAERMFFVTMLLNEVLTWVRSQPGTTSLRALLYMDEVFGYLPPTANPPSKLPMLTLLKQARAFGVGVVLATQNPVDLDYKALSNMGTWFLGRLQTERDKARVLDGLEGAAVQSGQAFDRAEIDRMLSGLKSRVFLMNNVHEDEPILFQTRWALSYLRGPLTREQIRSLTPDRQPSESTSPVESSPAPASTPAGDTGPRPMVGDGLTESFVANVRLPKPGNRCIYRPALVGVAKLHYVHAKSQIDVWEPAAVYVSLHDNPAVEWEQSRAIDVAALDCQEEPEPGFGFASLPVSTSKREVAAWEKTLKSHLYRNQTLVLLDCPLLKLQSNPGESAGDFRIRMTQAAHEQRDLEVEKLRGKYSSKLASVQGKIRTAQDRIDREKSQYNRAALDSAISWGSSILGALFGRKLASRSNISKASTSIRSVTRAAQQRDDVNRAQEQLGDLETQLQELEAELKAETEQLQAKFQPDAIEISEQAIRPRKSDIQVERLFLLWLPWELDSTGLASPCFEL